MDTLVLRTSWVTTNDHLLIASRVCRASLGFLGRAPPGGGHSRDGSAFSLAHLGHLEMETKQR